MKAFVIIWCAIASLLIVAAGGNAYGSDGAVMAAAVAIFLNVIVSSIRRHE